uniref:Uncharacterized protein n=1 Tax=Romanomermis culicivorax TaxID=13658 RepID=A0A915L5J4_ROMCU
MVYNQKQWKPGNWQASLSKKEGDSYTMKKACYRLKTLKNNNKKATTSAPPSTDALGIDLMF